MPPKSGSFYVVLDDISHERKGKKQLPLPRPLTRHNNLFLPDHHPLTLLYIYGSLMRSCLCYLDEWHEYYLISLRLMLSIKRLE